MKALKIAMITLGVLLALLIGAAIALPFMVDVDKYRPQIVEAAERFMNGKLTLGKLKLSLWGKLQIDIEGIEVKDTSGVKVLSVADAGVRIPLGSILRGSPEVILRLEQPEIVVQRFKSGQWNLLTLVKSQPKAPPAEVSKSELVIPALLSRARLGFELRRANLSYQDDIQRQKVDVRELGVKATNLSLDAPAKIEISAGVKLVGGARVEGPLTTTLHLKPDFSGGQFQSLEVKMAVELTQIEIEIPGVFVKSSKVAMGADIEAKLAGQVLEVTRSEFRFLNAKFYTRAKVDPSKLDLTLTSNAIDLNPWLELSPKAKGYKAEGGALTLYGTMSGPLSKLGYSAKLKLTPTRFLAPKEFGINVPATLSSEISIVTDQVETFNVLLKTPKNSMTLSGNVRSFTQPLVTIKLASSGMDLDEIFPSSTGVAAAPTRHSSQASQTNHVSQSAAGSGTDYDALLAPLRSTQALKGLRLLASADLAWLKTRGMMIRPLSAKLSANGLRFKLDNFNVGMFEGNTSATAEIDLTPVQPKYVFSAQVQRLNLKKAIEAKMESFKNTMTGTLSLSMKGSGQSFNPGRAKTQFNLSGSMKIQDAVFSTIDIGKMVNEALTQALERASEKVPQVKGVKLPGLSPTASQFEVVSSSFSVRQGVFDSPDFVARARANQGIDLDGSTRWNMLDDGLDAKWRVTDRYNVTKARDLSVTVEGVHVPHLLARGNDPVSFPVTVKCKLFSPCYSYDELPGHFAGIVLANLGDAVAGRARQELEKKGQQMLQEGLKNLFKH